MIPQSEVAVGSVGSALKTGDSGDPVEDARPIAVAEVLALAVRHLAELPAPTTLTVATPDTPHPPRLPALAYLTSSRARYAVLMAEGAIVFSPTEYEVMLALAEEGRAGPAELVGWCMRKLDEPGFRLTAEVAGVRGVQTSPPPRDTWWPAGNGGRGAWLPDGWTFERLFAALGVELVEVRVEQAERGEGREEAT